MVTAPQVDTARYAAASGLVVRAWAGEETAVVFCPGTVTTHLVSCLAAAVLEIAVVQAVTADDVVSLLADPAQPVDFSASDISADHQLMEETITGLVSAGLLRRVE